ncbi:hypothetical protein [Citreimonas sp.]|uniref:hypothetical protein n=1 Tax=Citreimonas sp. TaxID=3036715 RepID=UPI0035C79778
MAFAKLHTLKTALFASALALPAAVHAQDSWSNTEWDSDGNMEMSEEEFRTGFTTTGTFDAWDSDDQAGLSEGEFSTGVFADWDTDNDLQITEEEYTAGAERWYGADYATPYADYDTDGSGYIDRTEFGSAWDSDYYTEWDSDGDSLISEDEYTTGLYDTVDLNDDTVITVEEEGWFEGWFDGDDLEAEIQEVGAVN